MKQNKILTKIKSGEVKMKPKWEFEMVKSGRIMAWIISVAITAIAVLTIIYFIKIYNPTELADFGDLGWQIFYEDFPYIWGVISITCLMLGSILWLKIGNNYKRSWQKNLMITTGIILILSIVVLFLGF